MKKICLLLLVLFPVGCSSNELKVKSIDEYITQGSKQCDAKYEAIEKSSQCKLQLKTELENMSSQYKDKFLQKDFEACSKNLECLDKKQDFYFMSIVNNYVNGLN